MKEPTAAQVRQHRRQRTRTDKERNTARAAAAVTAGASLAAAALLPLLALAQSGPLPLVQTPFATSDQTQPNVFLQLDDSGSMGSGIRRGEFEYFAYYYQDFPAMQDYFPQGNADWRRSSALADARPENVLAFNDDPDERAYEPWWDTPYGDSDFYNARTWPEPSGDEFLGTTDLSRTGFAGQPRARWAEWIDDAGSQNDPPNGAADFTTGGDGVMDAWDSYRLFTLDDDNDRIIMEETSFNPDGSGANASTTTTILTGGEPEIHGQSIDEVRQRFANWYTYHRTPAHALAAAVGEILRNFPQIRFGMDAINSSLAFAEMPPTGDAPPFLSHNQDLFEDFREQYRSSGLTPLRDGLNRAGRYYADELAASSPIITECQQNFTLLMTDGYWNRPHSGTGDVDGDGVSNTLGDIGRRYYETDLAAGIADEVPASRADPLTGNEQDQQHMVSYGVAFGVTGNLEDTDDDGWPDNDTTGNLSAPFDVDSDWTDGTPTGATTIDDLWHMAYNSTGEFLNAQSPEELTASLLDAISSIQGRTGSAAAVAANTARVRTDSLLYQARYNSEDWSGDVVAFAIDSSGSVDTSSPVWKAADGIPGPTSRDVFSIDPDEDGEPGDDPGTRVEDSGGAILDGLTSDQADAINNGNKAMMRYLLLGDPSNEERNGGPFRDRSSTVLGDIGNSAPEVTRGTNFGYAILPGSEGNDYRAFVSNKQSWPDMLYVGANDGMLHAFDATDSGSGGDEKFAFVPNAVYEDLENLADPSYNHQFFVDGQVRVADAYYDGNWESILAGSTGLGAAAGDSEEEQRSVFALRVSDPTNFDEDDVLWEISGDDEDGLGHVLGELHIVRLNNDDWAMVFGNGYNSDDQSAQLFIVPLEEPDDPIIIDTEVGEDDNPNGLGGVTPADIDGDGNAEIVYGGDLEGNLWRFDLSASDSGYWDKSVLFETEDDNGDPQSIIAAPAIARHSDPGIDLNVLVGTGRDFVQGDGSVGGSPQVQTFYGIQDDGTESTVARGDLLEQQIQSESVASGTPIREVDANNPVTSESGWFVDLDRGNDGERVVEPASVVDDRIQFLTQVPDDAACTLGGSSWLYELDAESGDSAQEDTFDDVSTDADAVAFDQIATGLTGLVQSGVTTLFPSLGDATIEEVTTPDPTEIRGRQSWQELR